MELGTKACNDCCSRPSTGFTLAYIFLFACEESSVYLKVKCFSQIFAARRKNFIDLLLIDLSMENNFI